MSVRPSWARSSLTLLAAVSVSAIVLTLLAAVSVAVSVGVIIVSILARLSGNPDLTARLYPRLPGTLFEVGHHSPGGSQQGLGVDREDHVGRASRGPQLLVLEEVAIAED